MDLNEIILRGKVKQLERYLKSGGSANGRGPDGNPLLVTLCTDYAEKNVEEMVDVVLRAGADVSRKGIYEQTALHWAARSEMEGVVLKLLEAGAELDVVDERYGRTPLHVACSTGNAAIVSSMLDFSADPTRRDFDGQTPLHLAAGLGYLSAFQLLFSAGAELDAREGLKSRTVAHEAANHGQIEILSEILQREGGRNLLAVTDARGQLPLHLAVQSAEKDLATIELIAKEFPDALELGDVDGDYPIHRAAMFGNLEALNLLLEYAEDENIINAQNEYGYTPLMIATVVDHVDFAKELLGMDADTSLESNRGETAPQLARTEEMAELYGRDGVELPTRIGGEGAGDLFLSLLYDTAGPGQPVIHLSRHRPVDQELVSKAVRMIILLTSDTMFFPPVRQEFRAAVRAQIPVKIVQIQNIEGANDEELLTILRINEIRQKLGPDPRPPVFDGTNISDVVRYILTG